MIIFSIGDQVARTVDRTTESGNAVYNQSWIFRFTTAEFSPLVIKVKDMDLGVLGTYELPFGDIQYLPHKSKESLFSFGFTPTGSLFHTAHQLGEVRIPNQEKQCELVFHARITSRRPVLGAPLACPLNLQQQICQAHKTRRWTLRNCGIEEIDFIDNVQQWRELPVAKKMRVDTYYLDLQERRRNVCCGGGDEDDDVYGDRDLVLPLHNPSKVNTDFTHNLVLPGPSISEAEVTFLNRHPSLGDLVKTSENCQPGLWRSLPSLITDPEINDGEEAASIIKSTIKQPYDFQTTPLVMSVKPSKIPTTGDTLVHISGQNLGRAREDVKRVYICGCDCTEGLEYIFAEKLACRTKPFVPGKGVVSVYTKSGGKGVCSVLVRFYDPLYGQSKDHPDESVLDPEHKIRAWCELMKSYADGIERENRTLRKFISDAETHSKLVAQGLRSLRAILRRQQLKLEQRDQFPAQ